MNVWSGNISLEARVGVDKLRDIHIYASPTSTDSIISPNAELAVLSFVDSSAVPLHLIAGPAYEVFTENDQTERWFSRNLLGKSDLGDDEGPVFPVWPDVRHIQSKVGVLLQVDNDGKANLKSPHVIQLLLYAAASSERQSHRTGILTPPRSSSPTAYIDCTITGPHVVTRDLRLYALPILVGSDQSYIAPARPQSPLPESSDRESARFIPCRTATNTSDLHRKRQRLNALFEDAAHQVKRSKKRGGERVAKVMASLEQPHNETQGFDSGREEHSRAGSRDLPPVAASITLQPRKAALSRAHSMGSLHELQNMRPSSRHSVSGPAKRSTLNHVASVGCESSSPASDQLSKIENQNKAALSRIVMAGMRMYGMQQRKRSTDSKEVSEVVPGAGIAATISLTPDVEDQYKLIYHQTYKASSFVFRRQMQVVAISQGDLRDTVDRLLEMFCVDPIDSLERNHQGLGSQTSLGHDVFDSPTSLTRADEMSMDQSVTPQIIAVLRPDQGP